ncbi:MAG: Gfo/Idh/MocA family oxidoreductase, partial [Verrucomicrobiota bacterium]
MQNLTRRSFIKQSATTAAGIGAAGSLSTWAEVKGANDDIRVAIIGHNGKGRNHLSQFIGRVKGCRVVAICDADSRVMDRDKENYFTKNSKKVKTYQDLREVMDDKEIDAIVTATPNHWHSLVGIMACQSGKDAYVEKPISHNIWEGRQLANAAEKYDRVVQTGTQNRSDAGHISAIRYIQSGKLGRIKWSRGLCYKRRSSIGKVKSPMEIPGHIDYNLWCGPAPKKPMMRSRFHYDWHWVWDTGNGDLGNQGI